MNQITAVMFQGAEGAPWKPGIMIDDGAMIIDETNGIPQNVWNYIRRDSALSINVKPILDTIRSETYIDDIQLNKKQSDSVF
jgi:hypothetical protein